MAARTVGELVEILSKFPKDMPLWLSASCYTHGDHRVFTEIRPFDYRTMPSVYENSKHKVTKGVEVNIRKDTLRVRTESGEYVDAEFLCVENEDSDAMMLYED